MRTQQLVTTVTCLAALGGALVLAARPAPDPEGAAASLPRGVRVAAVERASGERSIRLPGVVRSVRRATLSFTVAARLAERPVGVGDAVAAGQLLARLDDRERVLDERSAEAGLAELEARAAQAGQELSRTEVLAEARAATAEELERARTAAGALAAARDAAAARYANARRAAAETVLRAPFAGTVVAVELQPGEWCSPGRPVVELAGGGGLEVVVGAPEDVRAWITEGSSVHVDLPFVGVEVGGRVAAVAAAAPDGGGLFPVKVTLADSRSVAPGAAAEVVLPLRERAEPTVPLGAVLDPGSSRPSVFIVRNGRAVRVTVEPGHIAGDRITVRGSLAVGESVVVGGQTLLADGDAVEVL